MSEKPSSSRDIKKKSTVHLVIQMKEEALPSTNKAASSEAENDATLQKDLQINAIFGFSRKLAGSVTQNTQLKYQPKLPESVKDMGLSSKTIVEVKTKVNHLSTITVKAQCISNRLSDEPGANIPKLKQLKKGFSKKQLTQATRL
jgi:hypothetical protein